MLVLLGSIVAGATPKESTAPGADAEGLAPLTPQADDGGFSEAGGQSGAEDSGELKKQAETKKTIWMDFEMFCKCFKYVFYFMFYFISGSPLMF